METLLQTYCFEIEVTCAQASEQDAFVRRMALHLVQYLAVFLAETITGLLQRVLTHPAQGLGGWNKCSAAHTEVLGPGHIYRVVVCLQPKTAQWLSQGRLSPVWWGCRPEAWPEKSPQMQGLKRWLAVAVGSTHCLYGFQHHGCPCSWCYTWKKLCIQPSCESAGRLCLYWPITYWAAGGPGVYLQGQTVAGWRKGMLPSATVTHQCWLAHFWPANVCPALPRLKEGILRDVFIQKAVVAWDNAPSNRIMVSLLLPGLWSGSMATGCQNQ